MRMLGLICALVLSGALFGAADLDMRTNSTEPFELLDVTTSAAKTVMLPKKSVLVVHTGYKSDGTASGASDYIVVQIQTDSSDASLTAGRKLVIKSGQGYRISGVNVPAGSDGGQEIQIKAVTGSAKVQFVVGG